MITEKKSLERFRMIRFKKVTNLELQKAFDFGIKIEYRFRKKWTRMLKTLIRIRKG